MPEQVDLSRDRRRVWLLAFVVALVSLIPYLYGLSLQGARPDLGRFIGFGYNLDDGFVYLSWMRQAADGHFFQSNLFTSEPQVPRLFNLFFLLLGNVARLTHLPLAVVFHVARIAVGMALIRALWWLAGLWIADRRARWAAILLLCFSAGLGWIPGLWHDLGEAGPVDIWQPEAISFFSIYLNPLFTVSMLLMVGIIGWLWIAQRDNSSRAAVYAGICGFLLGNIHTYDVITVGLVWSAFLIVSWVNARRIDPAALRHAAIAGLPTAISAGYNLFVLRTDPLFAARANVATLSAPVGQTILGYGLLIPLAICALASIRRHTEEVDSMRSGVMLLAVWTVVNFGAAYLPVPFQRKMLMGEHIPLCLLAGLGLSRWLSNRIWIPALAAIVTLCSLTNWRILVRDMASFRQNAGQSVIHRPYLFEGELTSLAWLREHATPDAVIQPLPWTQSSGTKVGPLDSSLAAISPGMTGHPVDAGHWGETPSFGETMGKWVRFMLPKTTDEQRKAMLQESRVRYLIFSQKHAPEISGEALPLFRTGAPEYLKRIDEASNADADVYEVIQ